MSLGGILITRNNYHHIIINVSGYKIALIQKPVPGHQNLAIYTGVIINKNSIDNNVLIVIKLLVLIGFKIIYQYNVALFL